MKEIQLSRIIRSNIRVFAGDQEIKLKMCQITVKSASTEYDNEQIHLRHGNVEGVKFKSYTLDVPWGMKNEKVKEDYGF
jgi:hypothetical protein